MLMENTWLTEIIRNIATNQITHFNKHVTSIVEKRYINIKKALESNLEDLPKVAKVIWEKIKDQLWKMYL